MSSQDTVTRIVILTKHYRIEGNIALVPGARVTDYMHEANQFFAVTEADVLTYDGHYRVLRSPFINVNRDLVEVIAPAELITLD